MNTFKQCAVIAGNKREILKLQQSVLAKWDVLCGGLKDEVNAAIRGASHEQLNQPNQLLSFIQVKINEFLMDEFNAAEAQTRNSITTAHGIELPSRRRRGQCRRTALSARDKFLPYKFLPFRRNWGPWVCWRLHSLLGGAVLLALSCCLFGLISLVIFWVFEPFINKILGWNTAAADGHIQDQTAKKD